MADEAMKIGTHGDMDVDIHSQAAGETLVERLQSPIPMSFDGEWLVDQQTIRRQAADRIQELETQLLKAEAAMRHRDIQSYHHAVTRPQRVATLVERLRDAAGTDDGFLLYDSAAEMQVQEELIDKLVATLRKIVGSQMIPWTPSQTADWAIGFKMLQGIAQEALENLE